MNMIANTPMIRHTCVQGSDEWHELRGKHRCASEAPVIMSAHPNMRRDELLEAKATYSPKEYSRYTVDKIFAQGHEAEAAMRPLVEALIGEELFPVICTRGEYLASYDGLTMMDETSWENKQENADLVEKAEAQDLPPYIYWQLEHQLMVNPDLQKVVFTVGNGNTADFASMEYTAVPGRREQLIAAWDQFEADRAAYVPSERKVEATGVRPDSLPALFVDVAGALTTSSNLDAFRAGAQALIGSIKTDLVTDQDFADAEAAIKWLSETEANIDMVINQALSKTGPLDALVRTLKDVQENLARATRLKLNKQVEAQKKNRRDAIAKDGEKRLTEFMRELNAEFSGVYVAVPKVDFFLVIKGKRSFALMESAVNDAIAAAKIQANETATKVRKNLALLAQHAEHDFLFTNKQALVAMDCGHLELDVAAKIAAYKKKVEDDDAARIQRHKNVIAGIEAAGEFDDSVALAALVSTRDRISRQDVSGLQEFFAKADQAKISTLAKLDARILVLREQAKLAPASAKVAPPAPLSSAANRHAPANPLSGPPITVISPDNTLPGQDDPDEGLTIHTAETPVAREPVCPTDAAIVFTTATQYQWTFDQACERMQKIDYAKLKGLTA